MRSGGTIIPDENLVRMEVRWRLVESNWTAYINALDRFRLECHRRVSLLEEFTLDLVLLGVLTTLLCCASHGKLRQWDRQFARWTGSCRGSRISRCVDSIFTYFRLKCDADLLLGVGLRRRVLLGLTDHVFAGDTYPLGEPLFLPTCLRHFLIICLSGLQQ